MPVFFLDSRIGVMKIIYQTGKKRVQLPDSAFRRSNLIFRQRILRFDSTIKHFTTRILEFTHSRTILIGCKNNNQVVTF